MDRDRRRFDDRRGGESYRPSDRPARSPSRGYDGRRRSPPRNRSRPRADTWVPNRGFTRPRSRSPIEYRRRSRTPPFQPRGYGQAPFVRRRSPPRRFSPRRDDRNRSPPPGPSWRSRSPYSEGRSGDASRGRSSPRRPRDISPGSQDFRTARRMTPTVPSGDRSSRVLSPRPPQPASIRSQSPSQPYRRDPPADIGRDRPSSRSRQTSPSHALASESNTTSRRSSPFHHGDRGGAPPRRSRSRSPAHQSPYHRPSFAPGRSPRRDHPQETSISDHMKGPEGPERLAKKQSFDQMQQPGGPRLSRNIPTQPRNLGLTQTPPLGPSQGLKGPPPHNRGPHNPGPHNASVLAAPTRPRHGAGSRDGPWMGGPSGPRRGPHPMPSHAAPSGPRASFTPPMSGVPGYRYQGPRHGSSVSASPMTPKSPNYLAGLNSIIPGGRALPTAVDATTEKRLSQLEADKEKLLDQMTAIQKSRRAGLRDWDRLDRESSICALKSELAEGHLQRMADESIGGGVLY